MNFKYVRVFFINIHIKIRNVLQIWKVDGWYQHLPMPHRREINQLMFQRTMDVVNIDSIRYFTKFKTYVFTMVPQKPM